MPTCYGDFGTFAPLPNIETFAQIGAKQCFRGCPLQPR